MMLEKGHLDSESVGKLKLASRRCEAAEDQKRASLPVTLVQ